VVKRVLETLRDFITPLLEILYRHVPIDSKRSLYEPSLHMVLVVRRMHQWTSKTNMSIVHCRWIWDLHNTTPIIVLDVRMFLDMMKLMNTK